MAATNKRILVVDDDGDMRELLALALRQEGYEVALEPGGYEAVYGLHASMDHAAPFGSSSPTSRHAKHPASTFP